MQNTGAWYLRPRQTWTQEIPQPSITKINLKITYLKFHWNLPVANELRCTLLLTWCHDMETYSMFLDLCKDDPPVTGRFLTQRASNWKLWCLLCSPCLPSWVVQVQDHGTVLKLWCPSQACQGQLDSFFERHSPPFFKQLPSVLTHWGQDKMDTNALYDNC